MNRENKYKLLLAALVIVVFALHIGIINSPKDKYVYDEMYYVPAAECLLNGSVCRTEHPPLGPAMIAGSMTIFGDNSVAWRLPGIILGTFSLVLVYLLVRRFSTAKTALLAAFLLGFENLWFTHSSIAMLDVPATFLILLGLYLFVIEKRFFSGIAIGIAMLVKEIAVVALPAILLYSLLVKTPIKKHAKKELIDVGKKVVLPALMVFLLGLGVYDLAYGAFPTPVHHLMHFVDHNTGSYSMPHIAESVTPLRWFSGFPATPYYLKTIDTGGYLKQHVLQYMGQANLAIILLIWLAIPFVWKKVLEKRPVELMHVIYFGITYAAFIIISFIRITHPFYMPLLMPSVCILIASMLSRFPKNIIIAYCVGVLAWFVFWFPKNVFVW